MRDHESRRIAEIGIRLRRRLAPALAAGIFLAGCASTDTRIVGTYPGTNALQDWRTIANTNRPGRGEILKIVDLGRSEALSNHLAIVQSSELPHRHKTHDSTVTILEGHGTMTIGGETRQVHAGAVIFIPRGVVHHYANEGDSPTVALVVYAPPFDGQDREVVTGTGTERSPEAAGSGESAPAPTDEPAAVPSAETAPAAPEAPAKETAPATQEAPEPEPGVAAPAEPGGEGRPGVPASTDEPGAPAGGGTEAAPGDAARPEPSPGAVMDGGEPAPPPPAP